MIATFVLNILRHFSFFKAEVDYIRRHATAEGHSRGLLEGRRQATPVIETPSRVFYSCCPMCRPASKARMN